MGCIEFVVGSDHLVVGQNGDCSTSSWSATPIPDFRFHLRSAQLWLGSPVPALASQLDRFLTTVSVLEKPGVSVDYW